jgi:hypothetical protein
MELPKGREGPPGPNGAPKRLSLARVGFVSMCLATAMTLPALIWLLGGNLCGRGRDTCSGPADMPVPAVVLLWLSVPLGLGALAILIWAATKLKRSGEPRESNLVKVGIVMAVVGTLIVANICYVFLQRIAGDL